MATTNDVTGDSIQTKNVSDAYRSNYDLIFRKPVLKSENNVSIEVDNEKIDSVGADSL